MGKGEVRFITVATALAMAACDGKHDPPSVERTQAALTDSAFDIDGDLIAGAGDLDWVNVPGRNTPGPNPGNNGLDLTPGGGDDAYKGGSKNDDISPDLEFGSIPAKDDLTRFYIANEHVACVQTTPASPGCPCQTFPNGCEMAYIAWERGDASGSANVDVEFNQLETLSGNNTTPLRSAGDMIISFDFDVGGTVPLIRLSRWITAGANALCEANNGKTNPGCWADLITLNSDQADAKTNDDPPDGPGEVTDTIANPDIQLAPNEFGETAINLTAAGVFQSGVCTTFGRAFAKSRSSSSFTAALKDIIKPIQVNINNCRKIQLLKVDQNNAPLGGAGLQLWKESNTQPGLQRVAGGGFAADTLVGSCTSATGDSCSGTNCSFNDQGFGTYYGFEATAPNGYTGGATVTQPIDPTSPSCVTITLTNTVVPGTINITKQDDEGAFVNGAIFTLTPSPSPIPSTPLGCTGGSDGVCNCTTGDTGPGTCSITNIPLGNYTLDETVPTGYLKDPNFPKTVVIGLGPSPGVGDTESFTAINKILHKLVVFVCDKRNNTLLASNTTFFGSTKASFAAGAPPPGFLESLLCLITTGATFDNLPQGTYNGQVIIDHP